MITTKKMMKFYIRADSIMNRGGWGFSIGNWIKDWILPDYTLKYLKTLRKVEFYSNTNRKLQYIYKIKLKRLGYKTGFSIAKNVFGYGLVIPHHGTIVVGDGNEIGNYAVLHTCVCITVGQKKIGDALYCSTGCKILGNVKLGNAVTIGANAVVNFSSEDNCLLVGIPAIKKRCEIEWYNDEKYKKRVSMCEELKRKMFADFV